MFIVLVKLYNFLSVSFGRSIRHNVPAIGAVCLSGNLLSANSTYRVLPVVLLLTKKFN